MEEGEGTTIGAEEPIKVKTRTIIGAFLKRFIPQNIWLILAVVHMVSSNVFIYWDKSPEATITALIISWICAATHFILKEIRVGKVVRIGTIQNNIDGQQITDAIRTFMNESHKESE